MWPLRRVDPSRTGSPASVGSRDSRSNGNWPHRDWRHSVAIANTREIVGMILWYCQGEVGYYHLAAYSPRGYAENASYALFWASAERLRGRVRWLSLGAGAGATCDGADGLTRFKRGWSPLVRPAYLGRHVAQSSTLCRAVSGSTGDRFLPGVPVP